MNKKKKFVYEDEDNKRNEIILQSNNDNIHKIWKAIFIINSYNFHTYNNVNLYIVIK